MNFNSTKLTQTTSAINNPYRKMKSKNKLLRKLPVEETEEEATVEIGAEMITGDAEIVVVTEDVAVVMMTEDVAVAAETEEKAAALKVFAITSEILEAASSVMTVVLVM